MVIADRSMRCVPQPPTSSAYFSTARKPGVVLRVPATSPCHPAARASEASACACVATPEARDKMLSAVRSPNKSRFTGPRTTATRIGAAFAPPSAAAAVPSAGAVEAAAAAALASAPASAPAAADAAALPPSRLPSSNFHSTEQPSSAKTWSKKGRPASTQGAAPRCLQSSRASRGASPTTKPPTSKDGASSCR